MDHPPCCSQAWVRSMYIVCKVVCFEEMAEVILLGIATTQIIISLLTFFRLITMDLYKSQLFLIVTLRGRFFWVNLENNQILQYVRVILVDLYLRIQAKSMILARSFPTETSRVSANAGTLLIFVKNKIKLPTYSLPAQIRMLYARQRKTERSQLNLACVSNDSPLHRS